MLKHSFKNGNELNKLSPPPHAVTFHNHFYTSFDEAQFLHLIQ